MIWQAIDYFHYDVTHAKVSGSCSKDRSQGRSIAGKLLVATKACCYKEKPEEYSTAVIEEIREVLEQRNPCSRTDCIVSAKDNDRF